MPSEKARRAYRPVVENLLHRPATEVEVDGFIRRVRLKLLIFGAVILALLALGAYFFVKPALTSLVVPRDGGGTSAAWVAVMTRPYAYDAVKDTRQAINRHSC